MNSLVTQDREIALNQPDESADQWQPGLYDGKELLQEGTWHADYRRLRVVAVKL